MTCGARERRPRQAPRRRARGFPRAAAIRNDPESKRPAPRGSESSARAPDRARRDDSCSRRPRSRSARSLRERGAANVAAQPPLRSRRRSASAALCAAPWCAPALPRLRSLRRPRHSPSPPPPRASVPRSSPRRRAPARPRPGPLRPPARRRRPAGRSGTKSLTRCLPRPGTPRSAHSRKPRARANEKAATGRRGAGKVVLPRVGTTFGQDSSRELSPLH